VHAPAPKARAWSATADRTRDGVLRDIEPVEAGSAIIVMKTNTKDATRTPEALNRKGCRYSKEKP